MALSPNKCVDIGIVPPSQCSINSARFSTVCASSGASGAVNACSRAFDNSVREVLSSSVQHDTKAALNKSRSSCE